MLRVNYAEVMVLTYRIDYGPPLRTTKPRLSKKRVRCFTIGVFFAFLMLVKLFWPEGRRMLTQLLIPGGAENRGAFVSLAESIQGGVPLGDALYTFCSEVLENASGN